MFFFALALGGSLWGLVVLLTGELAWPWKTIAIGIVVAALALQFIPPLGVHFLFPLLMQVFVAVWASLHLLWPRDI
jgi:hypothetical protein